MIGKIFALVLFTAFAHGSFLVPRVNLSDSGPETSMVGWGTIHVPRLGGPEGVRDVLRELISFGVTLVDLADVYGGGQSNSLIGQALQLDPTLRSQLQFICKFNIGSSPRGISILDSTRENLIEKVDYYLDVLNTDYCDVAMFHAPDALMDVNVIVDTVIDLIEQGKIHHFGLSNYPLIRYDMVNKKLKERGYELACLEAELSVLIGSGIYDGRVDYLQRENQAYLAWGPLGGDPLGRANRLFVNNDGDIQRRILGALETVGEELGVAMDTVAVSWLLRHPAKIIPLIGSVNLERLRRQAAAVEYPLSIDQWTLIQGAAVTDNYVRWEQLHSGFYHDVYNDYSRNVYGTPFGVDVPPGFTDFP